ncbi:MAG: hypothetical protein M3O50_15755, partial [Myxococcota bacterium]|nr:hypothetical protein [Myxococcota bacterium]
TARQVVARVRRVAVRSHRHPPSLASLASGSMADPGVDPRSALLERGAIAMGESWAEGWREDLRQQGRRIAGGWPGTIAEARARTQGYFTRELRSRSMDALTTEELDRLARAAYARARTDWLSRVESHEPEG